MGRMISGTWRGDRSVRISFRISASSSCVNVWPSAILTKSTTRSSLPRFCPTARLSATSRTLAMTL